MNNPAPARSVPAVILVFAIDVYRRFVSPLLPPSCRFTPSCSQYAKEALLKHGLFRGLLLAVKRLARWAIR